MDKTEMFIIGMVVGIFIGIPIGFSILQAIQSASQRQEPIIIEKDVGSRVAIRYI